MQEDFCRLDIKPTTLSGISIRSLCCINMFTNWRFGLILHYFALHLMLNPHCNLRLAHPTEAAAQLVSWLLTVIGLIPRPCSVLCVLEQDSVPQK